MIFYIMQRKQVLVKTFSSIKTARLPGGPSLIKYDRFVSVNDDAVFQMPFYGSCQHAPLNRSADILQILCVISVIDAFNILFNNRPFVKIVRHIVRGRAD